MCNFFPFSIFQLGFIGPQKKMRFLKNTDLDTGEVFGSGIFWKSHFWGDLIAKNTEKKKQRQSHKKNRGGSAGALSDSPFNSRLPNGARKAVNSVGRTLPNRQRNLCVTSKAGVPLWASAVGCRWNVTGGYASGRATTCGWPGSGEEEIHPPSIFPLLPGRNPVLLPEAWQMLNSCQQVSFLPLASQPFKVCCSCKCWALLSGSLYLSLKSSRGWASAMKDCWRPGAMQAMPQWCWQCHMRPLESDPAPLSTWCLPQTCTRAEPRGTCSTRAPCFYLLLGCSTIPNGHTYLPLHDCDSSICLVSHISPTAKVESQPCLSRVGSSACLGKRKSWEATLSPHWGGKWSIFLKKTFRYTL